MNYVFTRAPLDEDLLPQIAHALQTRIDSLSRLKYPGMWEQADRAAAKTAKDYAKADEIRNALTEMGVVLKDSKEGTTWTLA